MVRRRSPVQARPTAFYCFLGVSVCSFLKLLFSLTFLFVCNLFSEVRLIDYSGDVKYRLNSFSDWVSISTTNFIIPDGGAVKTENGKAKIMIDKTTIWMKENTAVEFEVTSKYFTNIGLVYGRIKACVNGLVRRSRFQIRTVSAVFTIRGTDIAVESDIKGKTSIDVVFGEVEFEYVVPPKTGKRNFVITQGISFSLDEVEKPYKVGLITREREREILSNWDPHIPDNDTFINIKKHDVRVNKLKNFISYSNIVNEEINRFIHKERDADFEAGRTLRDIHGNLVRVDQRIIRPDPYTLQLFNIVKREDYKAYDYSTIYSDNKVGFRYNGGGGDRTDSFIVTFNFNKALPKNVNEWQSYFSDDSLNPNWASFVAANVIDLNNVFFIGEGYKYISKRGELINNTEVVGVSQTTNEMDRDVILLGKISKNDLNSIVNFDFREENLSNTTGNLVKKTDNSLISGAIWGLKTADSVEYKNNEMLYQLKSDRYLKGANQSLGHFWVSQENYVISNNGSIRSKNDIINSNLTITEIIKENAIESIFYVKTDSNGNLDNSDYNGYNYNIDLVFIGDAVYQAFEKISSGVDRFKD